MAGYIIVDVEITHPEKYDEYRASVSPSIETYGGRFLVRGGPAENLEGDWTPKRVVVLEFDSAAQAKKWWNSEEYREPRAMRQAASVTQMILVEGT
jgi:uncharacterized protein (DUF1330 family)